MSMSKCHFRTVLLKNIMDRKFSTSARHEIMHLFKDINPNQKERIAAQMLPLIESSNSEREAVQKAAEMVQKTRI